MASDTAAERTVPPEQAKASKMASYAAAIPAPARYVDTATAYNLWAATYDNDGNFLQAIDTEEMQVLVPAFLSQLQHPPISSSVVAGETQPVKLVDLGCGTGRNTLLLHRALAAQDTSAANIVGLDVSQGMLDVAHTAIARLQTPVSTELFLYDMLHPETLPIPKSALGADGVISTLVIEHVPISVFFQSVVNILKPGGVLLLTNMHSDMGSRTQAGFFEPGTGERVRGTSYAHSEQEIIKVSQKFGFEVIAGPKETAIDHDRVKNLSERALKYVGVQAWFGVMFRLMSL